MKDKIGIALYWELGRLVKTTGWSAVSAYQDFLSPPQLGCLWIRSNFGKADAVSRKVVGIEFGTDVQDVFISSAWPKWCDGSLWCRGREVHVHDDDSNQARLMSKLSSSLLQQDRSDVMDQSDAAGGMFMMRSPTKPGWCLHSDSSKTSWCEGWCCWAIYHHR